MTGVYILSHIRSLIVSLELMAISRLRGDSIIVCARVCKYTCIFVCMRLYMYVYMYIYIYLYKLRITCMGNLRV